MHWALYVLVLVGITIFLVGLAILVRESRQWLWPKAQGNISESEIEEEKGTDGRHSLYRLRIRYWYTVNGREYSGTLISEDSKPESTQRFPIERLHEKYPLGQTVTVYYDPLKNGRAVLNPGFSVVGTAMLLFGLVLIMWPMWTAA